MIFLFKPFSLSPKRDSPSLQTLFPLCKPFSPLCKTHFPSLQNGAARHRRSFSPFRLRSAKRGLVVENPNNTIVPNFSENPLFSKLRNRTVWPPSLSQKSRSGFPLRPSLHSSTRSLHLGSPLLLLHAFPLCSRPFPSRPLLAFHCPRHACVLKIESSARDGTARDGITRVLKLASPTLSSPPPPALTVGSLPLVSLNATATPLPSI